MMRNSVGRETATIYQFPAGGRPSRSSTGREAGEATVARLFPPVAIVEFGSGWYHAAAIEADSDRKH